MDCPICNGSGVARIPHAPSIRGRYMDERYWGIDARCGACNGTGKVPDVGSGETTPYGDDQEDVPAWTRQDTERLVQSVQKLLGAPLGRFADALQRQFCFGRYRAEPADAHTQRVDQMKLELLANIHQLDVVSDRFRAEMAILVSRVQPDQTDECRDAMGYFDRNKPASGASLIGMGLELLRDQIWGHMRDEHLGLY